jgi:hypothetical protein
MNSGVVEKIAQAILYEGYLLYPYRQSALKNQQRWNFGVLYPPAWAAEQTGSDRSYFQMECVACCGPESRVDVSVRFLQLASRESAGRVWQEAVERKVDVDSLSLAALVESPTITRVSKNRAERPEQAEGVPPQTMGQLKISAIPVGNGLYRLSLRVSNTGDCQCANRDEALIHSLASAHAVLHLHDGTFVSQVDPPDGARDAVAACQNTGVWPVLVGDPETRDTMLGSPIILYDYPQVAPESDGDLFDATEIDEILTLRILTLTDAEKQEVRDTDEQARRLLERLETSPSEHLLELHGRMRSTQVKQGDRVRLRPRKRADIFDTLLAGKVAIVEAVELDFEGNIHFAVVLEEDPGRDLGEMRQAGHRFFFSPEEVEPLASGGPEETQS